MKELASFIPLLIMLSLCFLGYRFLRFKGFTSWWYLLAPTAILPFFWIILGAAKSRNPDTVGSSWSYAAVSCGCVALIALSLFHKDTESALANITLSYLALSAFFGYRLMKLKGYTSWNYVALIISATSLFWFIFGILRANNTPTPQTKKWSYVAVLWGIVHLFLALYFSGQL